MNSVIIGFHSRQAKVPTLSKPQSFFISYFSFIIPPLQAADCFPVPLPFVFILISMILLVLVPESRFFIYYQTIPPLYFEA